MDVVVRSSTICLSAILRVAVFLEKKDTLSANSRQIVKFVNLPHARKSANNSNRRKAACLHTEIITIINNNQQFKTRVIIGQR